MGGGSGLGVSGGRCELKSEVFVKIGGWGRGGGGGRVDVNGEVKFFENSKKNGGGGWGFGKKWGGGRVGGRIGRGSGWMCERRIEDFVTILIK